MYISNSLLCITYLPTSSYVVDFAFHVVCQNDSEIPPSHLKLPWYFRTWWYSYIGGHYIHFMRYCVCVGVAMQVQNCTHQLMNLLSESIAHIAHAIRKGCWTTIYMKRANSLFSLRRHGYRFSFFLSKGIRTCPTLCKAFIWVVSYKKPAEIHWLVNKFFLF